MESKSSDPRPTGRNLLIAITGASGSIYASRLLKKLAALGDQLAHVGLIFSDSGEKVWRYELDENPEILPWKRYANNNFFTPPASGSGVFDAMIIIPCTMGTMASVAGGMADDLIARAADVMLKERRMLILVPREMPFNLIHIRNMEQITLAGGVICPAMPSFYSHPASQEELVDTVVDKVLRLAGFRFPSFNWGSDE
jgi:flavin prenyltransferase